MEPGTFKQKYSTEKDFSTQRKNFLYLPKNDKFFKRKKVSHPPEIAGFPFKEIFFIFTQNYAIFQGKKNFFICPRKQIFQTKNFFIITGKNKFSKQKNSYTCLTK